VGLEVGEEGRGAGARKANYGLYSEESESRLRLCISVRRRRFFGGVVFEAEMQCRYHCQ